MTLRMWKSQIIIEDMRDMKERIATPTVGEIIIEEFMRPLNMSVKTLANGIKETEYETLELLEGRVAVTPELSQKLAKYLGMSDMFFYHLQKDIDMRQKTLCHEEI